MTGNDMKTRPRVSPIDASSKSVKATPELPRVIQSHSESLKNYQESCTTVQSHPERGTPEQSGNRPTDQPTDRRTDRPTNGPTDRQTYPLIRDARTRLKRGIYNANQKNNPKKSMQKI